MFAPIETQRLTIRAPKIGDLDELVTRRNDPDVAKYQAWTVPYPRESAEQVLLGAEAMDGPTDGQWWMATVVFRDGGEIIGDLAVHVGWGGRSSEIGYSISTDYRGKGYAAEAVNALIHYLFEDFGVTRINAMMHPDNIASTMVAERAGMTYEGRTKLSFWVGEGDAAENSDDLLYGLVRQDWDRWRQRPTGRPENVTLIDVTADNQRAVSALRTHKSQEGFVAPVAASFANALFPPAASDGGVRTPRMQAVEADGELAGFIMLATGRGEDAEPYLWRFLVDRFHQRRGIGSVVLDQVEGAIKDEGHRSILVSWVPGKGSPEPFYLARGYEPTGNIVDGEVEARKML